MNKHRLTYVDGLRGMAALAVFLGHWLESISRHMAGTSTALWLDRLNMDYFNLGRFGVVAFFCISGFVIPFSFKGSHPKTTFIVSRFFRLYPAYWVSIIIAVVVLPLLDQPEFDGLTIASNFTMLQKLMGQPDILGVYWTLFVELMFYGICWLSFSVDRLKDPAHSFLMIALFLCFAGAMAVLRWGNPEGGLPAGLPTFLAAMHFGTLTRQHLVEGQRRAAALFRWALLLLTIGVPFISFVGYSGARVQEPGWIASISGYAAGLLLFILCVKVHLFAGRLLVYLGTISYSLYLFHFVAQGAGDWLWQYSGSMLGIWLLTPAVILFGIGIAAIIFHFVEAPMVAVGKKIDEGLRLRQPYGARADANEGY